MTDIRIIACPACGGEGRDIRVGQVFEPGCGFSHVGDVDRGPCEHCGGKGEVEIKIEPITLADLESEDA